MRKTITCIGMLGMFILFAPVLYAQDIITLKTGVEMKVTVVELTPKLVKYRKTEDGPIYTISRKEVSYIVYEDGDRIDMNKDSKRGDGLKNYDDFPETKFCLHGGINVIPLASRDFTSFDISDWQQYGLKKYDPTSQEGRVHVPLGATNANGYKGGIFIGAGFRILQPLRVSLEYQGNFSQALAINGLFLGLTYFPVVTEHFKLGIDGRIGFCGANAEYGNIKLIPDYTPPVIIPAGTFTNGDTVSAVMNGKGFQLGIRPTVKISDAWSFFLAAGYTRSFANSTNVYIYTPSGKIKLKMSDPALVKPDGDNHQIGINPSIWSRGLYVQVGVTFPIGDRDE